MMAADSHGRARILTNDLNYDLPPERIAQHPASPRDSSRLMILHRSSGEIEHAVFRDLPRFLRAGDCLVFNRTRVMPARFVLRRTTGGRINGLFVAEQKVGRWQVMLAGGGRLRAGEVLQFEGGHSTATFVGRSGDDDEFFEIDVAPIAPAERVLAAVGRTPLPPYIRRPAEMARAEELRDRMDYQTVFARESGSIAAPTAGLHFTEPLLAELERGGVETAHVTLHVGLGTFQPVEADDLSQHPMHREWCSLPAETAERVEAARRAGGRVIAVGTTSVRTLESQVGADGKLRPGEAWTDLLIAPPYEFRVVDALLTNFHLPRSTLLALVFAFAGRELTMQAYQQAIELEYRFYSFGDAMLII